MKRSFNTYRRTGTTVPRVQEILYDAAATFKRNSLVTLDVDGEVVECGADPTSVLGVALNAVETKPGFDVPNSNQTVVYTGRKAAVSVAIADGEQEFSARGVNGGTDPVTPLQSHIGQQYGVGKSADGSWYIDISDQVNAVVEITDINTDKNFFACKFLAAVRLFQ